MDSLNKILSSSDLNLLRLDPNLNLNLQDKIYKFLFGMNIEHPQVKCWFGLLFFIPFPTCSDKNVAYTIFIKNINKWCC